MPKLPPRLSNYKLARSRYEHELPWYRPSDFAHLKYTGRVVLVNGAYDILTASHMRLLFAARHAAGQNGTVICALDSDEKIRASKGESRPYMSWVERAAALSYMPINCLTEINTRADMDTLMANLKPTLRVQGYEYLSTDSRYPNIPKLFIRDSGFHTSSLVDRILTKSKSSTTLL
jgi:bifunctional ADP-heptose synthase (sugar kinase/adenylyltransferase)